VKRRSFLGAGLLPAAVPPAGLLRAGSLFEGSRGHGPFRPYWESLKAYRTPEWFRDAKFGIWAHWTPQSVPEAGDWYARNMYIQGTPQYEHHVRTYGHPSRFGYKDICNLWKAERWKPDALIRLYKRAGAEYLVAIANHHDNFDCWNSRHHVWNAVNVGPRRDIVGTWARAARAQGLKFGVSYHGTPHRTWDEFMPVRYNSDRTGPFAGVPYDGRLTAGDGAGKWWSGLDPVSLNGPPHAKNSPCPEFVEHFLARVQDVIDQYDPDMLTFDDGVKFSFDAGWAGAPDLGVWLGIPDLAPQIIAYYYNRNMERRGGRLEGVLNLKEVPEPVWRALTRDLEMLVADKLQTEPWQLEACIGNWHYDRQLLATDGYKKPSLMIPMFVDIVSKNGNLLLSIPLPGHGEHDVAELAFLDEFAAWNAVNAEAIKGTRPWSIYGEGPSTLPGANKVQSYQLDKLAFGADDIRFTTRGTTLYAIALGWPADGMVRIKALAQGASHYPRVIGAISLLGSHADLKWSRGADALKIRLPENKPCNHAFAFRIRAA